MTIYFSRGSKTSILGEQDYLDAIDAILAARGPVRKVLAVPPDHTRLDSQAGPIMHTVLKRLGKSLTDVMPALGTHSAMNEEELTKMFGDFPRDLIRVHDYKNDVDTLGYVDAEFVTWATEGHYRDAWPAQVNKMISQGDHDLILSIGQVVPHEVIGMANYTKNIFVGTGGSAGIDGSHYLSALYGMERIMGRCDTPLRKILNRAADLFIKHRPIVYVLTVVESTREHGPVVRGLYAGDDHDVFTVAGELAAQVNCFRIERAPKTIVVWMDPAKYKKTWVANKSIYRTRMAIADGGRLVVIAPGVARFGEHDDVDSLIRKYGYRTTLEVVEMVAKNADLRANLSTAAHLIHASPENRFRVEYCTNKLTKEELESVGYFQGDPDHAMAEYNIESISDGWYTSRNGEEFYFIRNAGLGLWMHQNHPHAF
ncbi:lactate racemase domain-containing protein [Pirellulaceae bacterium SH449]